jgi:hypothetical protein
VTNSRRNGAQLSKCRNSPNSELWSLNSELPATGDRVRGRGSRGRGRRGGRRPIGGERRGERGERTVKPCDGSVVAGRAPAEFGHLRSFDRALRWTFERRLRPDNGPSPDGHTRQVIDHYSRLQCSRSGRSSIENTVNLVREIRNLIRLLTLSMIRRLHQTPGFPDGKNFIHRRQSLPAEPCEMKSEFSGTYLLPVEKWRASLLQPLSALQSISPRLLYWQQRCQMLIYVAQQMV